MDVRAQQNEETGKRPIKSLLVSSLEFPPRTGGISRVMGGVASSLGRDQVCCLTAVTEGRDASPGEGDGRGPKVYRRPSAFTRRPVFEAFGFGAAIMEVMIRERPRAVQIGAAYDGYIGLWLQKWLGLPFVTYAHGNEVFNAMNSTWAKPRLSLTRAAAVITLSEFTAGLVRKAGVSPDRIEVIHPGCDIDRFRPREPLPDLRRSLLKEKCDGRVILSVGRLVSRKGQDMVIRALPQLLRQTPNVTYLIVGDGPDRVRLEELAAQAGVRDNVVFAGEVEDDRLPDIYAISDAFVMPSRDQSDTGDVEGFGLVFLEASACSKPVVAGRSGGIPDAVLDGVTGLLVDPLDPEAIAAALSRVLSSPEMADRLGREGRARVEREFTWPHFAQRLQAVLRKVVEQRSSAHQER
jgi:phosphatidyl-myo-inositol dimannoside synthase